MDAQDAAGQIYDALIRLVGAVPARSPQWGRLTKINNVDTKISIDTPEETPTPAPPAP
jgi:hypothetical protein